MRYQLVAIDVGPKICPNFIKSYIVILQRHCIVVDPGPMNSLEKFVVGYEQYCKDKKGCIILTHIHIDHAGSASTIASRYNMPIYVHPLGVKHIINPSKLWSASLKSLGELALEYGEPRPCRQELVISTSDYEVIELENLRVRVIHTPGHAPHHQVIFFENEGMVLTGDACGIYIPEVDRIIPTTPPPFRYREYLDSLLKISKLNPRSIAPTHYGITNGYRISEHIEQVKRWFEFVNTYLDKGEEPTLSDLIRHDDSVAEVVRAIGEGIVCEILRRTIASSLRGFIEEAKRLREMAGRR